MRLRPPRFAAQRLWLAEKDGRIVGCIAIVEASPDTAQLRWFLVTPNAPARAGRPTGRRVDRVQQEPRLQVHHAPDRRALKAAARVYEKAGFVLVHEKPDSLGGVAVVEQMYEMSLS